MKRFLPAVATLTVLVACIAGPARADGDISERRSIAVTGIGTAKGTPDIATINIGVVTSASTAIDASKANETSVAKVMQALTGQRIDRKDIRTSDYSIWPEQRYDPDGSGEATITGYRVSNTVSVTVRDTGRLGEVLGAVTNAGANSINGIAFDVENRGALEAEARAEAMKDARAQASELAKLAGVELGEVLSISLSGWNRPPVPGGVMMMAARVDAAPPPSIAEGQLSVTVQVQVTYAIR